MKTFVFIIFTVVCIGCSVPEELRTDKIPNVKPFDINKYIGKWYEIARFDHSFERGLEQVTAEYSYRDDGKIKVINRGFNPENQEWDEAEGKAWIPDTTNPSLLKVSFFWIFSADYKIIKLDTLNYNWSVVTSNSKEYLWILARKPVLDSQIYNDIIKYLQATGFDISKMIKVIQ